MRIAINLGSTLLGKALQDQLVKEPDISDVRLLNDSNISEQYAPDFLIVDAHTIRHSRPELMLHSKNVLLDYGLSEETISSLIIYNKIDGIIATDMDISLLVRAFKAIGNGQIWIDNGTIRALVNFAENSKDAPETGILTAKERDVVKLVSEGLTNKHIASALCVSEQTVKTHLNSIFKKLDLSRRTQLVPLGIKLRRLSMF
jgi:DNA-binding NarL/FixJ family response regulator